MKYNFTDEVRKALAFARDEAIRLKHDYVGTEHMLLGALRASDPVRAMLRWIGADPDTVRGMVEQSVRPGRVALGIGELPYTARAKKTLELTMAAARELGDAYIRTEHLLLGLVREEKGIAAQVLTVAGVTEARALAAIRAGNRQTHDVPGFVIRIDDTSDASIYEQIVARVQEAVATGELSAGDRLPSVRRLADQLDIAPGTVARAYSELERLRVVVTEGARGTRVAQMPRPTRQEKVDSEVLVGLLRPVAVAAFHMGAAAEDLRAALDEAMDGIFEG